MDFGGAGRRLVDGGFELVFEDGGAEVGLMGRFVEGALR